MENVEIEFENEAIEGWKLSIELHIVVVELQTAYMSTKMYLNRAHTQRQFGEWKQNK